MRTYGVLCLIEAQMTGTGNAGDWPAVINHNGGHVFVRDLRTSGYKRAVADVETPDWFAAVRLEEDAAASGSESSPQKRRQGVRGPDVSEYSTVPATTLFPSVPMSPRLPIKEPPAPLTEVPSVWANVDDFGADQQESRILRLRSRKRSTPVHGPCSFRGHIN